MLIQWGVQYWQEQNFDKVHFGLNPGYLVGLWLKVNSIEIHSSGANVAIRIFLMLMSNSEQAGIYSKF